MHAPDGETWEARSHPYASFLHEIEKPARYVGGEYGIATKPWDETRIRMAIAFPDLYELGMSHLGIRILYGMLNARPHILAERVFAPWKDLERKLRESGLPLVTLESGRPLAEFDVLGFSLQYELNFTNVLCMLDLAGLPLRADARDNRHPLVIAGGPVALQPEPLAPFVDAFLIGDAEHTLVPFVESYVAWRDEGLPRPEVLARLAGLGGVYCPSLYRTVVEPTVGWVVVGKPERPEVPARVVRQYVRDLSPYPFPSDGPVPSAETIFDRFSVEIARGCTEGCRFCQAGIIYRPVRERSPDDIVRTLLGAVRGGGYDEASLTTLSTADFSCISPLVRRLMDKLREEKVSLSVSSLRAYGLPDDLLDSIGEVRNTSLTFAPEAGTQRMRDVISKNISEEDMDRAARAIFSRGWKRCKLYFMIGLPTETDEDVAGIVATARRYLEIGRSHRGGRSCQVIASVSTHVPKPHAPFQWAAMDGVPEILRKQALLQREAERSGVILKWHDAEASHLEGILGRGDRRVADLVEYAFRQGCRFDGWSTEFRYDVWMRGLEALGIDAGVFLGAVPLDARLPWDHIDTGVDTRYLQKEYGRALQGRLSPPCGKPAGAKVHPTNLVDAAEADSRRLVCYSCGTECDLDGMKEERRRFLVALDATSRPADAADAVPRQGSPGDGEPSPRRSFRPRTAIVNRPSRRYRLVHTKLGRTRYLSHLDLVRMVPRLIRRAGLTMTYSLGFHPKPRMVFSPALPLGWGSHGEVLDAYIEDEVAVPDLIERLNRAAPPGLRFVDGRELSREDSAVTRRMRAADYSVALPGGIPRSGILEGIATFRAGPPVQVSRVKDGKERTVTVSPAALLDAALAGGGDRLILRLRLDVVPLLRPDDLCRKVLGLPSNPPDVERIAIWCWDGAGRDLVSPLDLGRLRRDRVPASPAAGTGPP